MQIKLNEFQQLTMSYWLKARVSEVGTRDIVDHYNDILWLAELVKGEVERIAAKYNFGPESHVPTDGYKMHEDTQILRAASVHMEGDPLTGTDFHKALAAQVESGPLGENPLGIKAHQLGQGHHYVSDELDTAGLTIDLRADGALDAFLSRHAPIGDGEGK